MLKTFVEIQRGHRKEKEKTNRLITILEALKAISENNGGKNIDLMTECLYKLYNWSDQLETTIETNEKLGRSTKNTPTTPATEIVNEYLPKF